MNVFAVAWSTMIIRVLCKKMYRRLLSTRQPIVKEDEESNIMVYVPFYCIDLRISHRHIYIHIFQTRSRQRVLDSYYLSFLYPGNSHNAKNKYLNDLCTTLKILHRTGILERDIVNAEINTLKYEELMKSILDEIGKADLKARHGVDPIHFIGTKYRAILVYGRNEMYLGVQESGVIVSRIVFHYNSGKYTDQFNSQILKPYFDQIRLVTMLQ